jgi:alanine dehydrogenase
MKFIFLKPPPSEKRVSILPQETGKLSALGCDVLIESGFGEAIDVSDNEYVEKGSRLFENREKADFRWTVTWNYLLPILQLMAAMV